MTRPLRVAHVITKMALGGAQESALVTCEGLDPARFRQELLTGIEVDEEGTMFDEAARRGVVVKPAPELIRAVRPWHDLKAARTLAVRLERAGADLVHTHSSKAGLVGRLAARRLGVPVIHSVHGWSFNDEMAPVLRRAVVASERWSARHTAALVVEASPDLTKGIDAKIGHREQYHLIRNGIDLNGLTFDAKGGEHLRESLTIPRDALLVGTIGRLADQKDPLSMVRMFEILIADGLNAHFIWAGDGPLRPAVEAAVEAAGLTERFHLLGVRRDVTAVLSSLDVFALSSLWEGLPRTVTEAMAVGVPVAATAVDGCAEIIEPGETGLLVRPSQPAELAASVARLLGDPQLRGSIAQRARVHVGAWDRGTMLGELSALYDSVARSGVSV